MSDASNNNDALSAEKRKLFELLLKKRGVVAPKSQGIPRRSHSGPCALSFAQQRLWFVDRLQPQSSAYNVPYALRLTGDLDLAALEVASRVLWSGTRCCAPLSPPRTDSRSR